MSAPASRRVVGRSPSGDFPSLLEDIGRLRRDLTAMKDELSRARAEIARLEDEVSRGIPKPALSVSLGELRRQVSFFCHPDRGGDVALMAQLNALFDELE